MKLTTAAGDSLVFMTEPNGVRVKITKGGTGPTAERVFPIRFRWSLVKKLADALIAGQVFTSKDYPIRFTPQSDGLEIRWQDPRLRSTMFTSLLSQSDTKSIVTWLGEAAPEAAAAQGIRVEKVGRNDL